MASLIHPYSDLSGGQWLRGNLHTHTTRSDGARPPQAVIDDYAARGYGFLMLSDHDTVASEADYREWNGRGMVLVPGNEISAGGPHLLHVDPDRRIEPSASRQQVINDIVASGRGFAIVNHPDWEARFDHCTLAQLTEWTGYLGMEIYNGVISWLDGSPYATNKWDLLLSRGRRIWGFANDDSHRENAVELGWNVAYVTDRTPAGVVEALRSGRFYCSTGVVIRSIRVEGMKIRIETENAQRIAAIKNVGQRCAMADDSALEIEVPEKALYVRFECWGSGEKQAWTQPFFVETEAAGGPRVEFIRDWRVSYRLDGLALDAASPEGAAGVATTPIECNPAHKVPAGFVDLRPQIQGQPGIVYASTEIDSDRDTRGVIRLGYDGPIRVWLNGEQVFFGPGTNPAVPDQVSIYARFRRGGNKLLIALDSNGGKAWGVFARVAFA